MAHWPLGLQKLEKKCIYWQHNYNKVEVYMNTVPTGNLVVTLFTTLIKTGLTF